MLAAVKWIIKRTTVVVENENLQDYDGVEVVVTLLGYPSKQKQKKEIDWDSFVIPSERGQNIDGYMKEMRENGRL